MVVEKISQKLQRGNTHFGNHPIYSHERVVAVLAPEFQATARQINDSARQLGYDVHIRAGQQTHPSQLIHILLDTERKIKAIESQPKVKQKLTLLAGKAAQNVFGLSEDEVAHLFKKIELSDKQLESSFPKTHAPKQNIVPEYSDKVKELIRRRHSHDLLINGLAISAMLHAPKMFQQELAEIDPKLPHLYELHSNLAQYSNFFLANDIDSLQPNALRPPKINKLSRLGKALNALGLKRNASPELGERHPIQPNAPNQPQVGLAGESKLEWEKNGDVKALAVGFTFPILVQETIKAVAETCMAHGLPQKLSEGELAAWRKELHAPQREVWQFVAGKPVAEQTRELLLTAGFSGMSFKDWLARATPQDIIEKRPAHDTLAYSFMLLSKMNSADLEHIIKKALNPQHDADPVKILAKIEREPL